MNVVLIGYRGTGKTTIGKKLAERLDLTYVSCDQEIIRRAGMAIPRFVEKNSWEAFRDLEEEVVADVASRDLQVIDTGGGVIVRSLNVDRLKKTGTVFLLEATVPDIIARIGGDDQRPSLTGTKSFTEEVQEVLQERNPLYRKAADHIIDTSSLSAEAIVAAIIEHFAP